MKDRGNIKEKRTIEKEKGNRVHAKTECRSNGKIYHARVTPSSHDSRQRGRGHKPPSTTVFSLENEFSAETSLGQIDTRALLTRDCFAVTTP